MPVFTLTGIGPLSCIAAPPDGRVACPRSARPRQEALAALAAAVVLLAGQGVREAVMPAVARTP